MINCKKHIISACFFLVLLPLVSWSEAPVVDDSDNFAILENGPQANSPAVRPKYDEPRIENAELDNPQNDKYQMDTAQSDDGPALAKDDQVIHASGNSINDNATLIDKIQNLQKDLQELRGQFEVQAHDLKMLQQQQLSFYKDLDSRLATSAGKTAASKPPTDISSGRNYPVAQANTSVAVPSTTVKNTTTTPIAAVPASKTNPADEQISYLAAYELVKSKRYDDAITAMQTFSQKYPQGGYTANAEYWLGELYMVKKAYPKAIEHFEIVLQKFPSSSKVAASLLKAGYAYASSGNNQEAKKRLQQVVKNYPGTPTAQLANLKLESINAI